MTIDLKESIELKRGGLYAFQVDGMLTKEVIENVRLVLEPYEETHGVKFILMSKNFNLIQAAELRDAVKTILEEDRIA